MSGHLPGVAGNNLAADGESHAGAFESILGMQPLKGFEDATGILDLEPDAIDCHVFFPRPAFGALTADAHDRRDAYLL